MDNSSSNNLCNINDDDEFHDIIDDNLPIIEDHLHNQYFDIKRFQQYPLDEIKTCEEFRDHLRYIATIANLLLTAFDKATFNTSNNVNNNNNNNSRLVQNVLSDIDNNQLSSTNLIKSISNIINNNDNIDCAFEETIKQNNNDCINDICELNNNNKNIKSIDNIYNVIEENLDENNNDSSFNEHNSNVSLCKCKICECCNSVAKNYSQLLTDNNINGQYCYGYLERIDQKDNDDDDGDDDDKSLCYGYLIRVDSNDNINDNELIITPDQIEPTTFIQIENDENNSDQHILLKPIETPKKITSSQPKDLKLSVECPPGQCPVLPDSMKIICPVNCESAYGDKITENTLASLEHCGSCDNDDKNDIKTCQCNDKEIDLCQCKEARQEYLHKNFNDFEEFEAEAGVNNENINNNNKNIKKGNSEHENEIVNVNESTNKEELKINYIDQFNEQNQLLIVDNIQEKLTNEPINIKDQSDQHNKIISLENLIETSEPTLEDNIDKKNLNNLKNNIKMLNSNLIENEKDIIIEEYNSNNNILACKCKKLHISNNSIKSKKQNSKLLIDDAKKLFNRASRSSYELIDVKCVCKPSVIDCKEQCRQSKLKSKKKSKINGQYDIGHKCLCSPCTSDCKLPCSNYVLDGLINNIPLGFQEHLDYLNKKTISLENIIKNLKSDYKTNNQTNYDELVLDDNDMNEICIQMPPTTTYNIYNSSNPIDINKSNNNKNNNNSNNSINISNNTNSPNNPNNTKNNSEDCYENGNDMIWYTLAPNNTQIIQEDIEIVSENFPTHVSTSENDNNDTNELSGKTYEIILTSLQNIKKSPLDTSLTKQSSSNKKISLNIGEEFNITISKNDHTSNNSEIQENYTVQPPITPQQPSVGSNQIGQHPCNIHIPVCLQIPCCNLGLSPCCCSYPVMSNLFNQPNASAQPHPHHLFMHGFPAQMQPPTGPPNIVPLQMSQDDQRFTQQFATSLENNTNRTPVQPPAQYPEPTPQVSQGETELPENNLHASPMEPPPTYPDAETRILEDEIICKSPIGTTTENTQAQSQQEQQMAQHPPQPLGIQNSLNNLSMLPHKTTEFYTFSSAQRSEHSKYNSPHALDGQNPQILVVVHGANLQEINFNVRNGQGMSSSPQPIAFSTRISDNDAKQNQQNSTIIAKSPIANSTLKDPTTICQDRNIATSNNSEEQHSCFDVVDLAQSQNLTAETTAEQMNKQCCCDYEDGELPTQENDVVYNILNTISLSMSPADNMQNEIRVLNDSQHITDASIKESQNSQLRSTDLKQTNQDNCANLIESVGVDKSIKSYEGEDKSNKTSQEENNSNKSSQGEDTSKKSSHGEDKSNKSSQGEDTSNKSSQGENNSNKSSQGEDKSNKSSQGEDKSNKSSQGEDKSNKSSQGEDKSNKSSQGEDKSSKSSQGDDKSNKSSENSEKPIIQQTRTSNSTQQTSDEILRLFVQSLFCNLKEMHNIINRDKSNTIKRFSSRMPCLPPGFQPLSPRHCSQRTQRTDDSYPVSIISVRPLGQCSLIVKWMVHDFDNVIGYEVSIDDVVTNRYYSPGHNSSLIYGADLNSRHVIVVTATPAVENIKKNCLSFLERIYSTPINNNMSSRSWIPSSYIYNPY